jgi:hypothetical protein
MPATPPLGNDLFTLAAGATALAACGILVLTVVAARRAAQRASPDVRKAAEGLLAVVTPDRVDALLGRGAVHWREALELTLVAIGDDPRAQKVLSFLSTRPTRSLESTIQRNVPAFPTGRSGADVRAALDAIAR